MNYQSVEFLAFAVGVLFLYYIVPGKCQKYVLLLGNIAFYAIAGLKYIPFLLATMLVTFFAAKAMGKIYEEEAEKIKLCKDVSERKQVKAASKKRTKSIVVVALVIGVALLAVCKYSMFFLENLSKFISLPSLDTFVFIVPLGVSFYTFMALGYLLDIYWRRYKAEKSFVNYAIFLSYFPHVVQGPIDRYNEFKAQLPLENKIKLDTQRLTSGAQLLLWGFFKKLVIADRLGIFVDAIYDNYTEYHGVILVIATVLYSIQIYADFSGCIDIITGVSEMFGIKLRKNFDHPYFAKGMPEFWRRWHISLGEWFTDYVYYPASVSSLVKKVKKKSKVKKHAEKFAACYPVVVVWLITGIWHGASWKFVAWGIFHAILIVASVLFEECSAKLIEKLKIRTECFSWQLWQMGRTFFLCCVGRVFFRAPALMASFAIFQRMFMGFGSEFIAEDAIYTYGLDKDQFLFTLLAMAVLLVVDILQEHMKLRERLAKQNLIFRWGIVLIGIFTVLVFGVYGPGYDASSFIYEQF